MLRLLHTNDFHGTLDDARERRLAELRAEADLYFDCGDCVKAGNLAVPLKPDPVWERLARLDCSASVIGNRESQPLEPAFLRKLAGASHPLLCANLRRKDGSRPLAESIELSSAGMRVAVFGVMVPMVTERMASRAASHFLWDDPLAIAERMVERLRPRADCLVALTHLGIKQDLKLADRCPRVDLVLGGHSHTVLEQPLRVGSVWVCQTGSHGRYAGLYEWGPGGEMSARLVSLA